jgi:peptidoglycan/xylan/chitin deacetylase (PgdA/CDA1 family)
MNVHGNDYGRNDHVALAADLEHLTREGFEIRPLHRIVDALLGGPDALEGRRIAGVSCDDGPDFDYRDLDHPSWGPQRSVLNLLRDFRERHPGAQPMLHVTAFVIVSPEARTVLDRTCMVGRGWWNDDWWAPAAATGLMGIGNHSWDHNHESFADPARPEEKRGTFLAIDTFDAAERQVAQADRYLRAKAPNPSAGLFAYPYGEANAFLAERYLPEYSDRAASGDRLHAAFTTQLGYVSRGCDPWRLPRFTCGLDWKSPDDLQRILDGAAG